MSEPDPSPTRPEMAQALLVESVRSDVERGLREIWNKLGPLAKLAGLPKLETQLMVLEIIGEVMPGVLEKLTDQVQEKAGKDNK